LKMQPQTAKDNRGPRTNRDPKVNSDSDRALTKGAYLLHLIAKQPVLAKAGALGIIHLPAGHYVYVGSARSGIAGRLSRHKRLAETKEGKLRWHIDYLLVHPGIRLDATRALEGQDECAVSRRFSARNGVTVPIAGFGSSDCTSGCRAHFYRLAFREPGSNRNRVQPPD
jgi:Uri superfamily endonuclease